MESKSLLVLGCAAKAPWEHQGWLGLCLGVSAGCLFANSRQLNSFWQLNISMQTCKGK